MSLAARVADAGPLHGASSQPDANHSVRLPKKRLWCLYGASDASRQGPSLPRERSAPAKRRARARVGESEGRSPSD